MKILCKILFTLLLVGSMVPLFGQEAQRTTVNSSLGVAGGVMLLSNDVGTAEFVSFEYQINICDKNNPNRPDWCYLIQWRLWRLFPYPDPWKKILLPPRPDLPIPFPWENISPSDIEMGPAWVFTPSIGLALPASNRINISILLGGGFHYDPVRVTEIANVGEFSTSNLLSPVVNFGLSGNFKISDQFTVKLEFQGMQAFMPDMEVTGPDGSVGVFEGENMFSPTIGAGIGVNL